MSDKTSTVLIVIIAVFFVVLLFYGLVVFLNEFSMELKYLNNEIRRTRGEDRKHWQRQKRRLWLSLFPFIRY